MFGEGRTAPEAVKPRGLSDWVDEALLRLEHWQHRRVVITVFAALLLIAIGVGWAYGKTTAGSSVETRIPQANSATPALTGSVQVPPPSRTGNESLGAAPAAGLEPADPEQVTVTERYVVHVVGEVNMPGLVSVEADARVNAAVLAAGGPTADADLQRLNLASPLVDGMQIRVPAVGIEDSGPLLSHPSTNAADSGPERSGPIDLNSAPAEVLQTLPGVGPATASAIVSWREDNGGFQTIDELMDVPGIGPAKLAAVRDLVTV